VYDRRQKAQEEQKQFDKTKTLSCLASKGQPAALHPHHHVTGNPEIFWTASLLSHTITEISPATERP
jgi:hypothetical protein